MTKWLDEGDKVDANDKSTRSNFRTTTSMALGPGRRMVEGETFHSFQIPGYLIGGQGDGRLAHISGAHASQTRGSNWRFSRSPAAGQRVLDRDQALRRHAWVLLEMFGQMSDCRPGLSVSMDRRGGSDKGITRAAMLVARARVVRFVRQFLSSMVDLE